MSHRKLTDYLLNADHPKAKGKAPFFRARYGDDWEQLRNDLIEHAAGPTAKTEETVHGTVYVIEDELGGALVRSVWMLEDVPHLVTAYPIY